jgi:ecdysteroid 22-hydroxylase
MQQRKLIGRYSKLLDSDIVSFISVFFVYSATLPTDQGLQLWRFFNTPAYKRIKKSQSYLESVAVDLISRKMSYFEDSKECKKDQTYTGKSLLDEYLKNKALDLHDIVGMACDFLLAGVHTVNLHS